MDDAPLDFGLGKHGVNRLLESRETIHAKEQRILHSPVLQVVQHPQPELRALVGTYRDAENLLVPLRCDAYQKGAIFYQRHKLFYTIIA